MCVTAHPDDESLGFGGALARYAAEGVEVSVVVATRGDGGRYGDGSEAHPGREELGRIREVELAEAAGVLGVRHVRVLGYLDGALDQADAREAAGRIAQCLRELRPQVVLTFDPYGVYGHPDHVAICQLTLAGVTLAAFPGELPHTPAANHEVQSDPHQVQKVYYRAWTEAVRDRYQSVFKALQMRVDGGIRAAVAWPDWSVTTSIPAHDHWERVWEAVRCHRSQIAQYGVLSHLGPDDHRQLWGTQEYYRAYSLVNQRRAREDDLFAGIA